mgnify:CR=1 FL=1
MTAYKIFSGNEIEDLESLSNELKKYKKTHMLTNWLEQREFIEKNKVNYIDGRINLVHSFPKETKNTQIKPNEDGEEGEEVVVTQVGFIHTQISIFNDGDRCIFLVEVKNPYAPITNMLNSTLNSNSGREYDLQKTKISRENMKKIRNRTYDVHTSDYEGSGGRINKTTLFGALAHTKPDGTQDLCEECATQDDLLLSISGKTIDGLNVSVNPGPPLVKVSCPRTDHLNTMSYIEREIIKFVERVHN